MTAAGYMYIAKRDAWNAWQAAHAETSRLRDIARTATDISDAECQRLWDAYGAAYERSDNLYIAYLNTPNEPGYADYPN